MAYFHTTVLDNQIKALPTVSTASGSVATFDTDLTENLIEVKCQIVATQSGSGTPSPDNVRPIQTYTEMNVRATGKNLAQLFVDGKVPSISTGALVNSPGARSDFIRVEPNTDYTLSVSNSQQIYVFFYEENTASTYISYQSTLGGVTSLTVTTPNNCKYVMLRLASNDYTGGQFEKGDTATAYEPFGTTSNIPFGQTVAQGLLNVGTGKLRVTHLQLSAQNWTKSSGNYSTFYCTPSELPKYISNTQFDYKCSHYNSVSINGAFSTGDKYIYVNQSNRVTIKDTSLSNLTPAEFAQYMEDVQFIYLLDTPIEIQLDSITMQALLNENNIWCDTGDTSVKYILSVGKKIA